MAKKCDYKNLHKRYLIWLYKTTQEQVDTVERKFSQLEIDGMIIEQIKKFDKEKKLETYSDEFKTYIDNKKKKGLELKFDGLEVKPEFQFLVYKLAAIEVLIVKEFGEVALQEIKCAYEEEMIRRILAEREEKR